MDRLERVTALILQYLGPGHYINRDGTHFFGIAAKAPAGHLHKNGQKITDLGWITSRQYKIIVETSRNDEEVAERVIQLIVHKNDTTVFQTKADAPSDADFQARVEKAVAEVLRAKLEEINAGKANVESIAKTAAENVQKSAEAEKPSKVGKVGLQQRKPRLAPKEAGKLIDQENKLWFDRATILGLDTTDIPTLRDSRRYAKRWVQKVSEAWDAHVKGEAANA